MDMILKIDWDSIINKGRITATYKFALAKALVNLAEKKKTIVSFEELADYYTRELCTHIKSYKKQITAKSSKFLEACKDFNEEKIDINDLREITIKMGFTNVLERFHTVNQISTDRRYFTYDIELKKLYLTDDLIKLVEKYGSEDLNREIEVRWNEVEMRWNE